MHPSQSIPATASVTVADCGAVRQAFVQRAIVKRKVRLVIGAKSIENTGDLNSSASGTLQKVRSP
jgi:hypothetical protein